MNFRTAAMAAGLAAMCCTCAAVAQPGPPPSQPGAPSQQGIPLQQNGFAPKHARNGKMAQIKEDVRAGRISKREGKQLKQQLKAAKAQRRAQKQARGRGEYEPTSYSPPSQ
jgi:hypothetical protein